MRSRRTHSPRAHDSGNFWLSFSDLMSSLVLIIILVMFYIIYQYFMLAETNTREIEAQKAQLTAAQTELVSQQQELETARIELASQRYAFQASQEELEAAQTELASQQTELETAQAALVTQQADLETAQAALASQQTELETAQAALITQQTALDTAETKLASQQKELDSKQSALTQAQSELKTQQAALAAAQQQITDKEDEVALAQDSLDSMSATLSARENELRAAQASLSAAQSRLDEQQSLLSTQQAQIEQLVGLKPRIIASLSEAMRDANITASVDSATGAITMESDVLFTKGKHDLNASGKAFIDRLIPVYLDVLFDSGYAPYISEIIIEGHTDSDGSYLDNLELSQQRALAVADYILGSGCRTVSADVKNALRPVLTVNGRSYSDRIFDKYGKEDKDASRRVVFKFRMTDEQMIEQMRAILEAE